MVLCGLLERDFERFDENQRLDPPYSSALSETVSHVKKGRIVRAVLLAISSEDDPWSMGVRICRSQEPTLNLFDLGGMSKCEAGPSRIFDVPSLRRPF